MKMAYKMSNGQAFANTQMTMAVALSAYDKTMKGFLPDMSDNFPQIREEIDESRVIIALKPPKIDIEAPKLKTNGCHIGKSIP